MRVIKGYPPNWRTLQAKFNVRAVPGIIITYGPTLYVPDGCPVGPELIAHETVHAERQGADDASILAWWARYIADPAFRLAEELLGHRAEYQWFLANDPRNESRHRDHIAKRLSGPLYGKMISFSDAVNAVVR